MGQHLFQCTLSAQRCSSESKAHHGSACKNLNGWLERARQWSTPPMIILLVLVPSIGLIICKAVQNNLKNIILLKPSFFFYPWLLWHSLTSWAGLSYEIYCIWLYSHNSSVALPLSIVSEARRWPFRFSGRLTRPQRRHTAGVLSAPHTLTHWECSVGLWVLIVSKCFYFSHNLNKTA